MPKKPLRHNSSNLGRLAKSSYTASVHSSKPRSSRDSASLMGNSRDGPYSNEANEAAVTYNPRVALSQRGRHSLIEDGSEQALVV
jgi:hypothetical protein